jgi:hypothetical protein
MEGLGVEWMVPLEVRLASEHADIGSPERLVSGWRLPVTVRFSTLAR